MSNAPYEEWIDRGALMCQFSKTRHEHVDELGWLIRLIENATTDVTDAHLMLRDVQYNGKIMCVKEVLDLLEAENRDLRSENAKLKETVNAICLVGKIMSGEKI